MKKVKIVVLGIISNPDGEILLTRRLDPKFEGAHLKWDVPGGTNEFGESLEETLKREILEETGLEVTINDMLPHTVSKTWRAEDIVQHTLLFCFTCTWVKGKPSSKDKKIDKVKWVQRSELPQYDFLTTTQEFLNRL